MKKALLIIPILLVLALSSCGSYAYLDIAINKTANFGTDKTLTGLACINATDNNVYCFVKIYQGSIYRYNSTWNLLDSCTASGDTSGTFYMTNESYAYFSYGADCTVYNLTNISSGGACTVQTSYASNLCGATHNTYVSSISSGKVYTADRILNPSGSYAAPIFWISDLETELNTPDKNNNSTLYTAKTSYSSTHSDFTYYNNGVSSGTIQDPFALYGIGAGFGKGVYVSMQKTNGITWAYIVDINTNSLESAETDYLYKVNFTQAANFGASEISAISPLNSTYYIQEDTTNFPLYVALTPAQNGTLYFYFDNAYNSEIKINASNSGNGIFSASVPIDADSSHCWRPYFVDSNNVQWGYTEDICFTVSVGADNPADRINLWIAQNIFGIDSLPTARKMMSIIYTLIIAMLIVAVMSIYGKVHGAAIGQIFLASIIVMLIFFTLIGWFDIFLLTIIIMLIGFLIWKTMAG